MKQLMFAFAVALSTSASLSMAGDKLAVAQDKALDQFKTDTTVGQYYKAINAFSVVKSSDGAKGVVTVNYKAGTTAAVKTYDVTLNESTITPVTITQPSRVWGVKEMLVGRNFALEVAKDQLGGALYDTISEISVRRSAQGVAALVRLKYRGGQLSLNCHEHGPGEIDCH